MALLTILEYPDPRLRTRAVPVTRFDDALQRRIDDMFETMYAAPGIGLAAIQVGVAKRLLVMDLQPQEDAESQPVREPRVFINPEILETAEEHSTFNEGCLSIPDQYAEVERPAHCRVRWLDEQGERHEEQFEGLLATCIQHEVDHLNGIVFTDHLSRLKRQMLLKKLAKARKAAA